MSSRFRRPRIWTPIADAIDKGASTRGAVEPVAKRSACACVTPPPPAARGLPTGFLGLFMREP
jgi:hypothetical protein